MKLLRSGLKMTTVGKCLCGAIEVTSDEKPDQIIACYSESCQKACGGGASFNIIKADEGARLSRGETKIYNETADSGNSLERHFCGMCGSPIFSVTTAYPGLKIWKAGLFSDVDSLEVVTNIWCDSAPSWSTINNSIPSHGKSRQ